MANVSGSDEFVEHFCDPCKLGGENLTPHGYCDTCKAYLCYTCFKYHRVPLQTRHHVMLDKDELPTGERPSHIQHAIDICSDICAKHKGERLQFYCGDHDTVCCGACMMKHHKKCDSTFYIPDLNPQTQEQFDGLKTKLDCLIQDLDQNIQKSTLNVNRVKTMQSEALKAAQKFKKEVNDYLDKLLQDFEDKLEEIALKSKKNLKDIYFKSFSMKRNLVSLKEKLEDLQKSSDSNKLYVVMQKSKKLLNETEEILEQNKKGNNVKIWCFEPEQQLKDLFKNIHVMGKVV